MATLLMRAYPESALTFVVVDDYGLDTEMHELYHENVLFTNFADQVGKTVEEFAVDQVVVYGVQDYAKKLIEYIEETYPNVKTRFVMAHR